MKYDIHAYMVFKIKDLIVMLRNKALYKLTRHIWKTTNSTSRSEKLIQTISLVNGFLTDEM